MKLVRILGGTIFVIVAILGLAIFFFGERINDSVLRRCWIQMDDASQGICFLLEGDSNEQRFRRFTLYEPPRDIPLWLNVREAGQYKWLDDSHLVLQAKESWGDVPAPVTYKVEFDWKSNMVLTDPQGRFTRYTPWKKKKKE